jgi:hypothetical protein
MKDTGIEVDAVAFFQNKFPVVVLETYFPLEHKQDFFTVVLKAVFEGILRWVG